MSIVSSKLPPITLAMNGNGKLMKTEVNNNNPSVLSNGNHDVLYKNEESDDDQPLVIIARVICFVFHLRICFQAIKAAALNGSVKVKKEPKERKSETIKIVVKREASSPAKRKNVEFDSDDDLPLVGQMIFIIIESINNHLGKESQEAISRTEKSSISHSNNREKGEEIRCQTTFQQD